MACRTALRAWAAALALATLIPGCGDPDAERSERGPLMVFAAASLRDVAGDLAAAFERRESVTIAFNFAGSNTLAQQILAAPRADVFLSADLDWVETLERAGRTVPGTRRPFLTNRLVLIAHRDARLEPRRPESLAGNGYRFLALADPEAVPAGRYARAALERLPAAEGTVWQAVTDRLAPTLDVRAALALVESDPEIVGIVYRTDALISPGVRILWEFPAIDDAPILYGAVLIAGGARPVAGHRFLDFLGTPEAQAVARRHGFAGGVR